MSVKTDHYQKNVDRIHHKEIQDPGSEDLMQNLKITILNGVTCIECPPLPSKLSFREILEDGFEQCSTVGHQEKVLDVDIEYVEVEDMIPSSNWRYEADEEDRRFGDTSVERFATVLRNLFGGPVNQKLAFDVNAD